MTYLFHGMIMIEEELYCMLRGNIKVDFKQEAHLSFSRWVIHIFTNRFMLKL